MRSESLLAQLLGKPFDTVLLDLDGTVNHLDHPTPGAVELLTQLEADEIRYACLTNGGSSPQRLVRRLSAMGIDVTPEHIYSAGVAAVDYVLEHFSPRGGARPRVFNLATTGVQEMLEGRAEFVAGPDEPCDVVIAGDPTNAFAKPDRQWIALQLLRKGAALVGICADRVYPSDRGLEIGSGAFCAMFSYATGAQPTFVGKPKAIFFHELCRRLGAQPQNCLLIGDNLESDIAGAKAVGMRTVLTLTGVARREDAEKATEDRRPDKVVEDLTKLL
jgi:HAD superfamily hydrolase (TIGR01450 family)